MYIFTTNIIIFLKYLTEDDYIKETINYIYLLYF